MLALLAVLLLAISVWMFFALRARSRWNGYVNALRAEPGLVVVSTSRTGGKYVVTGLRDPLAPDPATTPEAVIQVYAARAWGWKGIFAVHSWIIMKRQDAPTYERYEVVGWGVRRGAPAIRKDMRPIDGYWAGNLPRVVVDRFDLWRNGAHAIWLNGWLGHRPVRVRSVNGQRGDRPWIVRSDSQRGG